MTIIMGIITQFNGQEYNIQSIQWLMNYFSTQIIGLFMLKWPSFLDGGEVKFIFIRIKKFFFLLSFFNPIKKYLSLL